MITNYHLINTKCVKKEVDFDKIHHVVLDKKKQRYIFIGEKHHYRTYLYKYSDKEHVFRENFPSENEDFLRKKLTLDEFEESLDIYLSENPLHRDMEFHPDIASKEIILDFWKVYGLFDIIMFKPELAFLASVEKNIDFEIIKKDLIVNYYVSQMDNKKALLAFFGFPFFLIADIVMLPFYVIASPVLGFNQAPEGLEECK